MTIITTIPINLMLILMLKLLMNFIDVGSADLQHFIIFIRVSCTVTHFINCSLTTIILAIIGVHCCYL